MTNPNPSIQEQIEVEARKRWYNGNAEDIIRRGFFAEGGDYAASLYESKIQELEKENERLKSVTEEIWRGWHESFYRTTTSMTESQIEKQANERWVLVAERNNIQPIK